MENKNPSVLIATPTTRGGIEPNYVMSVLASYLYLLTHGVDTQYKIITSSWISSARNRVVADLDKDFLMFVDSDIIFPADAIKKLLLANKDIIGGLYYKKGDGNMPVAAIIDEDGEHHCIKEVPDKVFEVDAIGTGFLLIKKTVFDAFTAEKRKELGDPFNFWTKPDGGEDSEDWSFCRRAKKLGFKIWCDPTIEIGHIGMQFVSKENFSVAKAYTEYVNNSLEYKNEIEGWMSPVELDWLYKTAKTMDSVAEIGSWKGKSTHALLSGCKGTVTAIDHFKGSKGEEKAHAEAKDRDIFADFLANVGSFKNLKVFKRKSLAAVNKFADKSVDMVFIDGEHTYEAVRDDIRAWTPKARKLVCGHDYNLPEVKQAVQEAFGEVDTAGSIWIVDLEKRLKANVKH